MTVEKRPYVGTWSLNNKQVYQHSPDCLVYINGDVTIPNAVIGDREPARINFQPYITNVSVDAGTQPGSASASISLSLPIHSNDSFVRDANFILRPGLEVHVYMRGYFPARGMFGRDEADAVITASTAQSTNTLNTKGYDKGPVKPDGSRYTPEDLLKAGIKDAMVREGYLAPNSEFPNGLTPKWEEFVKQTFGRSLTSAELSDNLSALTGSMATLHQYLEQQGYKSVSVELGGSGFTPFGHAEESQHKLGLAIDPVVRTSKGVLGPAEVYANISVLMKAGKIKPGGQGVYLKAGVEPKNADNSANWSDPHGHWDLGGDRDWVWQKQADKPEEDGSPLEGAAKNAALKSLADKAAQLGGKYPPDETVKTYQENAGNTALNGEFESPPIGPDGLPTQRFTPGTTARPATDLDDLIAYPYYHVFHGVVTQADLSYSSGVQNASLNCASMLHFWQYHQLANSASYFGARPTNSKLQLSLIGHPFTGKHPYEIIYTLFHDTAGAAGGVGFALSQKTNQTAQVGGESLWSLNIKYWERRFNSGRMMKLRLFGMNGVLYNSLQSAFLGRLSTSQLNRVVAGRFPNTAVQDTLSVLNTATRLGLVGDQKVRKASEAASAKQKAANESSLQAEKTAAADLIQGEAAAPGVGSFGLPDMVAFVKDINLFGQVNLFETTYQSKLDIVQEVLKVTGFEFFQDVDGDFVFKPPFYNMDSSTSRIYTVEDIDLISITISEKEPQATYSIGKGSHFKNIIGTGTDNEWGVEGRYIDYRLVAQFGWRPDSFEAMYFTNPRSLFYAAVNRIDLANIESTTASVTIPLRPEIRVGYPFYIRSYDCYYYCNSFSHSWTAGSQCTTSLQMVGKRSKFFPPGNPAGRGVEKVDLSNPALPPVTLEVLDDSQNLKLAGFPNVVMALDPTEVNPLFFYTQGELTDLENPLALANVLKIAKNANLIVEDPPESGLYRFSADDAQTADKFFIGGSEAAFTDKGKAYDLVSAAAANQAELKKALEANKKAKESKISPLGIKQANLRAENDSLRKSQPKDDKEKAANDEKVSKNNEKINQLEDQIRSQSAAIDASLKEGFGKNPTPDVALLLRLLNTVGNLYINDPKKVWGDRNSTANLLELLSDKKASFVNHGTPGTYRYFSCSHPDPNQQGVAFQFDGKGAVIQDSRFKRPLAANSFCFTPQIPRPSDPKVKNPEADLRRRNNFVERGFYIQQPSKFTLDDGRSSEAYEGSYRLLVSTAEIQNLEFGMTRVPNVIKQGSKETRPVANDFSGRFANALAAYLLAQVPETAYASAEDLIKAAVDLLDPIRVRIKPGAKSWLAINPLEKFVDKFAPNYKPNITDPEAIFDALAAESATQAQTFYAGQLAELQKTLSKDKTLSDADRKQKLNDFKRETGVAYNKVFVDIGGTGGVLFDTKPLATEVVPKSQTKTHLVHTPIFPVSDDKGYRVLGTYRYGRGIKLMPDNLLDQLTAADPKSLVSSANLLKFLNSISNTDQQAAAVTDVVKDLSKSLSKQQLINMGLLTVDGKISDNAFANFAADQRDSTQQVPATNAAFSLADLSIVNSLGGTSTRSAEADVVTQAFSMDFVNIVRTGDYQNIRAVNDLLQTLPLGPDGQPALDKVSQYQAYTMASKTADWEARQTALRGTAPIGTGDLINPLTTLLTGQQAEAAATNLDNAVEAQKQAAQKLKEAAGKL